MKHRSHITLSDFLFVIGGAEEGKHHTVSSQRRLDHVGNVLHILLVVKIAQILSGYLRMTAQVIVGSVRNAPEFAPAEGEQEFNVGGRLGVEGKLFLLMVSDAHLIFLHAKGLQPVNAELFPVGKPFQVRIRLTEKFQLHLFKFTGTEGEVTGRDFVTEGFSDLADAEGNLLAGSTLHVLEVDKNALCGFRTQIHGVFRIFGHALEGLEHQIELTNLREVVLSAGRAGNVMFVDEIHHLFLAPAVHGAVELDTIFFRIILDQLIRAEPFMTLTAVHQGIREAAEMSACHPGLGIHQNGTVHTHIITVPRDELLPPGLLHIIFQLHAQVTVIPGIRKTAVNLGAGIHKASRLGKRHNFFHCFFHNFLFPAASAAFYSEKKGFALFPGKNQRFFPPLSCCIGSILFYLKIM